jgi:hypothetical protein
VRSFPLPQRKSSAAQYFSQPQQIRSGCAGYAGIRRTIFAEALIGGVNTIDWAQAEIFLYAEIAE